MGKKPARVILFLPSVCSSVGVALMWTWIYEANYGVINTALAAMGLPKVGFMTTKEWFMPSVLLLSLWMNGTNIVLMQAALANVDASLKEAARIDGATEKIVFWRVTFPQITPTLFYILTMNLIASMQEMAIMQVIATNGVGPDYRAVTLTYYLYRMAFTNTATEGLGLGSALSWIVAVAIIIITRINSAKNGSVTTEGGAKIMIKHDNFGAKSLDFKPNKHKRKPYVGSHVMLAIILLFVLVPFYILLITSLESEIEANNAAFSWWPKMGLTVEAYKAVLFRKMGGTSVVRGLWNTLWIYIPGLIVGLFMSAMSAFSFAKLRFRGKNFMFSILMATMMIPNCMSTIASFLVFDNIGWVNTPFPLMIPRMFGAIGVVFFLRQYFMGIPDDLVGAARIDGLGSLGIFVKIMIGVAAPALIAQFILTFIGAYNDYMGPLIYLQDASMYTLQIALAYFADVYTQNWPLRMAGCVVAMLPLIILYFISQRYILKGIAISSGLKG